jgi:DNA-binding transcriptional MerR regulator
VNRKRAASSAAPKLYRSIREVSVELEVKPHVLRYWETQFPSLRPKKNRAGNRMYRPEEVKLLTRIKELLYAQRFTIEGARRLLTDEKKPRTAAKAAAPAAAPAHAPAAALPPAPVVERQPDTDRERLEQALAASQAELADTRRSLAASEKSLASARDSHAGTREKLVEVKEELATSKRTLAESRGSLAEADDRDKTRMAAMAVLRQELLLLARELRGEDERPEPRVAVRAVEQAATEQEPVVEQEAKPAPALEEEPLELPVGAIAVGA